MERVQARSQAESYHQSRLPKFTEEELDYISGTYDFMGLNTYATYLATDTEEYDFDGKPGYEKDIKSNITEDSHWKKGSNGYPVS